MKTTCSAIRSKFLWLAICILTMVAPAQATVMISCTGLDSELGADILFGAGPVPNVLSVAVQTRTQPISTQDGEPGIRGYIARSYVDDDMIKIDLVDDQALKQIASIRVLRFFDDDKGPFQIGYLQIDADLPVGISCNGP